MINSNNQSNNNNNSNNDTNDREHRREHRKGSFTLFGVTDSGRRSMLDCKVGPAEMIVVVTGPRDPCSYSLNSLKRGVIQGSIIGVIKGDARS